MQITLETLDMPLSICKLDDAADAPKRAWPVFLARTDAELSCVCPTAHAPARCRAREDGWRALRIAGQLDFSLVGILARIAQVLARQGVSIFAVSTFDTDYILIREASFAAACGALVQARYHVVEGATRDGGAP
nr:ACT domain-containing protein [Maliibacterium massiliense]